MRHAARDPEDAARTHVRSAQERNPILHDAQLEDGGVLRHVRRAPVPGVLGDIDEEVRSGGTAGEGPGERGLVADEAPEAIAPELGERIRGFLAVQNTYISTFLSLGGLGLLLGTLGLAAVQLRNVLERRGELALLRATGFRRGQLGLLVLLENLVLLLGGLAMGCAAALVALLPQLVAGAASVPWSQLALTLAAVLAVGTLAGALAARSTLRAPILAALRGS